MLIYDSLQNNFRKIVEKKILNSSLQISHLFMIDNLHKANLRRVILKISGS